MAGKLSRREWLAKQEAKVAEAQDLLEKGVAAIQIGDDWMQFLKFQASLHRYFPNNVMLIAAQHEIAFEAGETSHPDPGYVAGFNTWLALGRNVDKGQHGYKVLAPVRRKCDVAVDADGGERVLARNEPARDGETVASKPVIRGFKTETVFSQYQTSGEDLPDPPDPRLLECEAPRGLGEAVEGMLTARGWTVTSVPHGDLNGANGDTHFDTKTVRVGQDMDDAAMVKTLLHEAGHVLLHSPDNGYRPSRRRMEVEAESVAFVVAWAHGMPTDGYTFPYVASWAATSGADPAVEARATQTRVARAAKTILEVSPAEQVAGGKVPGVEQAVERHRAERARQRDAERIGRTEAEFAIGAGA